MNSPVLIDDDGPYFDLGNLFPQGVYAYFTLRNGPSPETGSLKAFLERCCSSCSVELCCSYRRDGDGAGRMAAVIGR